MDSCMLFKKHLDTFAFMPFRTVNIQPDFISHQFFANFMQTFQKSFTVSLGCSDNAAFTYQRCYPTKNIRRFAPILTACKGWILCSGFNGYFERNLQFPVLLLIEVFFYLRTEKYH